MVELTFQEGARLIRALRTAFPSRLALKQVIFNYLGQDLDAIADDDTYCGVLVRLIAWVEAERRTTMLIQGARKINPGNEWLRDFESEYNRLHPVAAGGLVPAPTVLTNDLRQQLVSALLRLPVADSFPGRTGFLLGIPASFNRAEGNARLDLESVLDQLDGLGRMGSGEWPLLVLIDNARSYAQGFAVENDLNNLRQTLEQAYAGH
jgi:hypothetical protein